MDMPVHNQLALTGGVPALLLHAASLLQSGLGAGTRVSPQSVPTPLLKQYFKSAFVSPGAAIGYSQAGLLPIVEIPYAKYLVSSRLLAPLPPRPLPVLSFCSRMRGRTIHA